MLRKQIFLQHFRNVAVAAELPLTLMRWMPSSDLVRRGLCAIFTTTDWFESLVCEALRSVWPSEPSKEIAPRFAAFPCQRWMFAGDLTRPALDPAPFRGEQ